MPALLLAFFILVMSAKSQAIESYGTYGLFPQGSARVMALGGAFTGLSDDAAGLQHNPAGMVKGNWRLDFSSTENLVFNAEADLIDTPEKDSVPYRFSYTAAALKLGPIVLSYGETSPFTMAEFTLWPPDQVEKLNMEIQSKDIAIAIALTQKFSIGAAYHIAKLTQRYSLTGNGEYKDLQAIAEKQFFSWSLSYWFTENFGFGAKFTPEQRYSPDTSYNSQMTMRTSNWFRETAIPQRLILGSFLKITPRWTIFVDADFVDKLSNVVYAPSGMGNFRHVAIQEKEQVVLHGGIEWKTFESKHFDFTLRGGYYREPERIEGAIARNHVTGGFETRISFLVLAVALDRAPDFDNQTYTLGLKLDRVM